LCSDTTFAPEAATSKQKVLSIHVLAHGRMGLNSSHPWTPFAISLLHSFSGCKGAEKRPAGRAISLVNVCRTPCPCCERQGPSEPVVSFSQIPDSSVLNWIAPLESTRESHDAGAGAQCDTGRKHFSQACSHWPRSTLRQLWPVANHLVGHSIPPWGARRFSTSKSLCAFG
jgi:hypothetical protein